MSATAESSTLEVRYHLTIGRIDLGQEHADNQVADGTGTESVEDPIDVPVHAPGPVVSGRPLAPVSLVQPLPSATVLMRSVVQAPPV